MGEVFTKIILPADATMPSLSPPSFPPALGLSFLGGFDLY